MRKIVLFFSVLLVILGSINLSYATDVNSTIDSKLKIKKNYKRSNIQKLKKRRQISFLDYYMLHHIVIIYDTQLVYTDMIDLLDIFDLEEFVLVQLLKHQVE